MLICPNCNEKDIGKIGTHQFYCWNCLIELAIWEDTLTIHEVEADGSLSSLDDLFTEEERKIQW
ncbi:hypothetical protein GCM10008983_19780 [Lentibacillus halophilus]|uniref:Inhibitor of sigma-G Gin n=1 Tax=Lentibacillus halophilus TaxID=295065 RepID=A0ABP3J5P7_9BACI